jgi:hypothetical protein
LGLRANATGSMPRLHFAVTQPNVTIQPAGAHTFPNYCILVVRVCSRSPVVIQIKRARSKSAWRWGAWPRLTPTRRLCSLRSSVLVRGRQVLPSPSPSSPTTRSRANRGVGRSDQRHRCGSIRS